MLNNQNTFVRSMDRLRNILGISSVSTKKTQNNILDKMKDATSFSAAELRTLRALNTERPHNTLDSLKQDMLQVSTSITKNIDDNKSYQAMVPEIGKAKTVLIPSILSPNDMYGETVSIYLECEKLDEELTDSIGGCIADHMNNRIHIGKLLSKWLEEALFDAGSCPVIILPKKAISAIVREEVVPRPSVENIDGENKSTSKKIIDIVVSDLNNTNIDNESLNIKMPDSSAAISIEVIAEIFKTLDIKTNKNADLSEIANEAMTNIRDAINISVDYRKIASVGSSMAIVKKNIDDKLKGLITQYGTEKVYSITDSDQPDENDEPVLIKLPPSSTIPIHVPGDPSTHIGYFVLIDEFGNPIDTEFRSLIENHTVSTPYIAAIDKVLTKDINNSARKFDALSMVFDLTLKKSMESAMKTIGISGSLLPDSSKLYSCIFNRALFKEKVTLVYVPTFNMAYYAFQYRENGTGKGLMEDSSFIIAMRTAFLIARVISTLDNSTDKTKISFDLADNKGTNIEQIMGLLKDSYMTKHMYNLDHNPMNVMRDIVSRSVSIIPKSMEGITDLNIDRSVSQGQASKPDETLEELLTNLIVTATTVPHSVLNQLGENEFSRSVATTNLLFSNTIRTLQNVTCSITEVLVKAITRNSYFLMSTIKDKLVEYGVTIDDEATLKKYLDYIIGNIRVTLPSTNIAPDNSRFSELERLVDTIQKTVTALIPDEMLVLKDEKAKETLMAVRANISRNMIKEAIKNIGADGLLDLDNLMNIEDASNITYLNRVIANYSSRFQQLNDTLPKEEETSSSGGSW